MQNKFIIEDVTPRFIIEDVEDTAEQTQADQTTDQPEVVSEEITNVEPPKKQKGVVAKTVPSTPEKNMVSKPETGSSDSQSNKKYTFDLPSIGTPKDKKQIVPKKEVNITQKDGTSTLGVTLPKDKAIAKAIKEEGPISERALGELKQGLYTTEYKKKRIAEIEADVYKEELAIENPYAKYSELNGGVVDMSNLSPITPGINSLMPKSPLTPQSYKVEVKGDTFVNDVFKTDKLKELIGDIDNFDGFISSKGYKDEFRKKQEMGLFEGTGTDISGGYDIQLAKESQKIRMLNLYMADRDARLNKLGKASNDILNLRTGKEERYSPVTTFDKNKVNDYLKTEAPTLYKKFEDQKELNKIEYEKASKDNSWYYDVGLTVGKSANSFVDMFLDRVNQVATTSMGAVGLDSLAEELRLNNEERQLSRPTTRSASYVSGKETNINGVNYLVDGNGNIYDADRKILVNDLLDGNTANKVLAASETGKDSSIFSPMGTVEQLAGIVGDMAVQIGLQGAVGKLGLLSKVPMMSKGVASSVVAQTALGYSSGYENTYKAAIDAGLPQMEAKSLAGVAGIKTGALYAITSPMSTQAGTTAALFGSAEKTLAKDAVLEYVKSGKKGFVKTFTNGLGTMASEGKKEFFQENVQQAGEMRVNADTNEDAKRTLLKDYITVDDFVNTSILSFGAGSLMASPHAFSSTDKLSLLKQIVNNESTFTNQLPSLVSNGTVTQKQADELLNDIKVYRNQSKRIPPYIHPYVAQDIMYDLQDIQDLEQEKKTLDPSFHAEKDAEIAELRSSIQVNMEESNKLISIDKQVTKDLEKTRTAIKSFGLEGEVIAESFETDDDLRNIYEKLFPVKEAFKDSKEYAEKREIVKQQFVDNHKGNNTGYGKFIPFKNAPTLLLVNKKNVINAGIVTTGQHEFLHQLLYNQVKSNPEFQKRIGTALYNHVESITNDEDFKGSKFYSRFEKYKTKYGNAISKATSDIEVLDKLLADGKINQTDYAEKVDPLKSSLANMEGDLAEEALTLLSESISSGDIKYDETFFVKLGDVIRRMLQKYGFKQIKFNDGKDVFNFIRDYNKSFEKGEFNKAFEKFSKGNESDTKTSGSTKESIASPKVVALEKELSDLEEEYDEGYGDMPDDEYRAKKNNIEAKIKTTIRKEAEAEASGKKVVVEKDVNTEEEEVKKIIREERGSLSSDKVQQIYEQKGTGGAAEIIRLFSPITKKIVDKRRDAPGFDRELLTDELETGVGGILDLITKYKPTQGVPLAAYINKYLPVRAIATSRRLLDAQFSKDVTEEVGLMATETADQNMTERLPEKPKYANALESNVFEPEVLETMLNKAISNLRLVKARIDAPTTLNRTISPLVAEIRDEMGRQVDIDVKTAMGGKKDNQLKNWLLKNKRYVLENMTTTWLMGKDGQGGMPQAIQKRIDGRWVNFPEWVGKRIDREATTTDLAGRTSGHELVRRLPGAFNNISNEDYLSQVLEPSGNPIRGRKEALAKAVGEETSMDLINEDFKNQGPIYEAFIANQQRVGVEISDNIANEFAKQAERGNVKYSGADEASAQESKDKLIDELSSAKSPEEQIGIVERWIASDGRSIRTMAFKLFGKGHKWLKNKGLFDYFIVPALTSSNLPFKWTVNGDSVGIEGIGSFNLKEVTKGLSMYLDEKKVELWADITYLKRNWIKSIPTINEEADEAVGEVIDFVNYYKKKGYSEAKFRDALNIHGYDQRGRLRKMHKAGIAVLGMKKADKPYLEHNKPSLNSTEEVVKLFNGDITEAAFKADMKEAKVNLVPDGINKFLPAYEVGKNRMHADDVVLYLKSLEDSGLELYGLENEYDSRENFDKMVAEAKARIAVPDRAGLDEAVAESTPEQLAEKPSIGKSDTFNRIIGEVTDMDQNKVFSDITARRRGAGINRYDFYVPPSAADFELLLYNFMGKGAQGEEHKKFFDDQFLKPYSHGIDLMDSARQDIKNDFKSISKAFPKVKRKLESLIPDKDFTYDQALRVAIWSESSAEIPGLSRAEQTKLADLVNNDTELNAFKEGLKRTSRQPDGWLKPEDFWETKTIISDLHDITEGVGRKQFLEEFIGNVEAIFGKWSNGKLVGDNMNKIEAVYGTNVREALEDSLYRMSNGKNRSSGQDKEAGAWNDWVNGSTGAIMFLNTRSAILQLTGSINFLNLRDNNPFAAAKAFANQPQYWKDFAMIFNSDKIKERRSGLKDDVSAAEIANAAKGSKNKPRAVLSYLLKIGYTPTQIADALAIAIGGASFYRNRVNTYLKDGVELDEAETKAWDDFSKVSDETQQSGDPRDISKQQASSAGRLILAFQNTSMQQSRIIKKSYLDLKNGRGDAKTHIAKIVYYLAIQNTLFAALQSGLFALMFDEDDEEDKEKAKKKKTGTDRALEIGNSVLDSILRGTGFGGAIVATLKNIAVKYLDERDKKFKADYAKVVLEAANISPPIGSKLRKAYAAMQTTKYQKDLIEKRGWSIMQDGRVHLSPIYGAVGKGVEATTNIPMDRFVNKVENISEMMNAQNKAWQRVMVGLGYTPYSVGITNPADEKIKAEVKAEKKVATKEKAKAKREFIKDSIANLPPEEYLKYLEKKGESKQKQKDSISALSAEEYLKYLEYKKSKRKKSPKASSAGNFIIE